MSTTGRTEARATPTEEVTRRLGSAEFVRLVAAGTGDAVAAAGLLADALDARGTPYQTSVVELPVPATSGTDADLTVSLGRPAEADGVALGVADGSAAVEAFEVAAEFATPDPALAVAGALAGGGSPGEALLAAAGDRGIERRPGLATPVADPADGLAHSTLVHAPFSGDVEASAAGVADLDLPEDLDDDARQRLASFVALSVASDEAATARGTVAVERFLRPLAGGPFGTLGGFGDVLAATARERPDLAVLLALGNPDRGAALAVWREHARRAHGAVREASTSRYDGLYVARSGADGAVPVGTAARLLSAYRSPEPVVLVVADGVAEVRAAAARSGLGSDAVSASGHPDVGTAVARAAAKADGEGAGMATRGRATYDVSPTEFVAAFREVL